MVFKDLCFHVLNTKVASALEGLKQVSKQIFERKFMALINIFPANTFQAKSFYLIFFMILQFS